MPGGEVTRDAELTVASAVMRAGEGVTAALAELAKLSEADRERGKAAIRGLIDSLIPAAKSPTLAAQVAAPKAVAVKPEVTSAGEYPPETVVQRMIRFLKGRPTRPATITEICEGAGITIHTARIYLQKETRNRGRFVKVPTPMGRPGLWKLADGIGLPPSRTDRRKRLAERVVEQAGAGEEE